MEEARELAALNMRLPTPISSHPREGGDLVVQTAGKGTPLGSRLRGNDWGV